MLTGRALERILYRTVIVGAVIVAPLFSLGASAATIPPTIAAASNLRFGLEEIARIFHRDTGVKVRLSFGSSGNFARQIRQGAPFELYMSADEVYVLDLARDEFTIGEGVLYAIGRIAIFAPTGSPLQVDAIMQGLRVMIKNGRLKHFAIANPEHAPYGRAAREVLVHAGLWEKILPRLVFGENISQAAHPRAGFSPTPSCARRRSWAGVNRHLFRPNGTARSGSAWRCSKELARLRGIFTTSFSSRPRGPSCAGMVLVHRMGVEPS